MSKKQATIRDVAKRAGVAPITVSRVVNNSGYVSEETRARVEQAVEELCYVPNSLAQNLRHKRTNAIALIVSDITNPFWTTVTRGVEDACSEHGLNVILGNTDEKHTKQKNYVDLLLQRRTDGILLVPIDDSTEVVQKIQAQGVPLVLLDRQMPSVDVDVVRGDSEGGAYQLTQHLIGLGHRRIAIISGPATISTSQDRVAGYRRALQESGLVVEENLIYFGEYNTDSGFAHTLRIMQHANCPTALFAGNNFIASGILKALDQLELPVPEAVSVVAFDDLPPSLLLRPFLTVVAQPAYEMGYRAAQLLIDQILGKKKTGSHHIVLPVELIIRQSSQANYQ